MNIAVGDEGANLIAHARMDGASADAEIFRNLSYAQKYICCDV